MKKVLILDDMPTVSTRLQAVNEVIELTTPEIPVLLTDIQSGREKRRERRKQERKSKTKKGYG